MFSNSNSNAHHHFFRTDANDSGTSRGTRQMPITNYFTPNRNPTYAYQKAPLEPRNDDSKYLFFPTDNFTPEDLLKAGGRAKVVVNEQEVALRFHEKEHKIYAFQEKCPHMGGPLHQGDIEDLPGRGPCVKCPFHKWTFKLNTGDCIIPKDHPNAQKIEVYPVQWESKKPIKIGFTSFAPSLFTKAPE